MTPRFYCTEPSDEAQFEQDKRPLKEEIEFISMGRQPIPEHLIPFGQDTGVQECDLFWYPELQR